MAEIKVSVIIPVYNTAKYLQECLDSVIKQTLKNIEIICIDDGSSDDSALILKEYAERDQRLVVFLQDNKGLSAARNVGIKAAKGQYIYFLDSDDYIEADALEIACRESDNRKLDILFFDTYNFGDVNISETLVKEKNKMYTRNGDYPEIYTGEELLCKFLGNQDYLCAVWLQLISRDLLQRNKLSFCKGIIFEDELYTLQAMVLAKRAAYLPRILHNRRLRQNSIITSPVTYQHVYSRFVTVKEAYPFLLQHSCNVEYLPRILERVRGVAVAARNIYVRLSKNEQIKYTSLTEREQFLFRLFIVDYAEIINRDIPMDQRLHKFITVRLDIKNFGAEGNAIEVIECSDKNAWVSSPGWFKNAQGQGVVIQSLKGEIQLKIKCSGNGMMETTLRGVDFRDKNNNRVPVWIDLKKMNVNGEDIFTDSHVVCHDKPLKYRCDVEDGEIVTICAIWQAVDNTSAY